MTELYFMCGYILGLFFPDFDIYFQETLGHRSIIFHSLFLLMHYLLEVHFVANNQIYDLAHYIRKDYDKLLEEF